MTDWPLGTRVWLRAGDTRRMEDTGGDDRHPPFMCPWALSPRFSKRRAGAAIHVIKSCLLHHHNRFFLQRQAKPRWNKKVDPRLNLSFSIFKKKYPFCHLIWHQLWISLLHSLRFPVKKQTLIDAADLSHWLCSDKRADLQRLRACLHSLSFCHRVQNCRRANESLTPTRSRRIGLLQVCSLHRPASLLLTAQTPSY